MIIFSYLILKILNRHIGFDVWVWVIVFQLEIFELETENVFHVWIDVHGGQRSRVAGQLQFGLFHMVGVYVCVA